MLLELSNLTSRLLVVYSELSQAQQVAVWLLEKLLQVSSVQILTNLDLQLTAEQAHILDQWLEQLVEEHKPLQYILGNVPFLDLEILVEPPILIPRLETEWWVSSLTQQITALKNEPLKILDLCSGTGCIGLALASYFPNSQVTAVDISAQACALIAKNKQHNNISNLRIVHADLYAKLARQKYDLIVANPPYVPRLDYQNLDLSVRLWEDRLALVAPGEDLAVIKKIITLAPNYLQKKYADLPQLWLEIDATQGAVVVALMQAKFERVGEVLDQFGRQRVVIGK